MKKIVIAACVVSLSTGLTVCAQSTFTGSFDADWTNEKNWSAGYPGPESHALLNKNAVLKSPVPSDTLAIHIGTEGTGKLDVSEGGTLRATAKSSWNSVIGSGAGHHGTVHQTGGELEINELEIGTKGGAGLFIQSGGLITVCRGINGYSLYLGSGNKRRGVAGSQGTVIISGGLFTTRTGAFLGSEDDVGKGVFQVMGGAAEGVRIGADNNGDGTWYQNAGSLLKASIDADGLTPITICDKDETDGQSVTFEAGALLEVDFSKVAPRPGAWVVMELENGDIVDQGLKFSPKVDTSIWSFSIDNSGDNGILTVWCNAEAETGGLLLGSL